jgi:hypothetical protein
MSEETPNKQENQNQSSLLQEWIENDYVTPEEIKQYHNETNEIVRQFTKSIARGTFCELLFFYLLEHTFKKSFCEELACFAVGSITLGIGVGFIAGMVVATDKSPRIRCNIKHSSSFFY